MNKLISIIFIIYSLFSTSKLTAQNVGINTTTPNSSAQLDVVSTTSGFAMPRMTSAQRKAIANPIAGLQVFDIDLKGFYYYTGTKWDCVSVPAGNVNYFANISAPDGYLECNGQSVSTTNYAELFAAIGYLYGGAGATFNVPDLRGEFIRGIDNTRGVDVGRIIGTAQSDDFKSHIHSQDPSTIVIPGPTMMLINGSGDKGATTGGTTQATGGTETRPRNLAMLPCIKF